MHRWFQSILYTLISLLVVLVLWEIVAVSVLAARGVAFPSPWQTLARLTALLGGAPFLDHSLYHHVGSSVHRWLAGVAIACVFGPGLGLDTGGHSFVRYR